MDIRVPDDLYRAVRVCAIYADLTISAWTLKVLEEATARHQDERGVLSLDEEFTTPDPDDETPSWAVAPNPRPATSSNGATAKRAKATRAAAVGAFDPDMPDGGAE